MSNLELSLNVSRILLLDTPFEPNMLNNNQAVIVEVQGKPVLMTNVDIDYIKEQVKKNHNVT